MIENIKVAALVPTRGDRPDMLANMHRMMGNQTFKPHGMIIVDDQPVNPSVKDITYRYRIGLTRIFEQYPDCDVVALIEDDDYYHPEYIKTMSEQWAQMGRPSTFGYGETYYYHLGIRAVHHQKHPERSSAFTTFMTRALLNMNWPKDDHSFVDIDIWKQFPGRTVPSPAHPLALGIKGYKEGTHFGGIGHNDKWAAYKTKDPNLEWLARVVDAESLEFYKSIMNRNEVRGSL